MNEVEGYAVFFFPQALEALGEAIKPYLVDGPAGPHLLCREIDTGGALIEMTLSDSGSDRALGRELMVPTSMVRMIVSARVDEAFGFGPRPPAVVTPAAAPPVAESVSRPAPARESETAPPSAPADGATGPAAADALAVSSSAPLAAAPSTR